MLFDALGPVCELQAVERLVETRVRGAHVRNQARLAVPADRVLEDARQLRVAELDVDGPGRLSGRAGRVSGGLELLLLDDLLHDVAQDGERLIDVAGFAHSKRIRRVRAFRACKI